MKKVETIILLALICVGIGFRLYRLGSIPAALNRDEAALGYNAWAIAHYGTDEWGKRYPLTFESFGDYKLPGYIYLLSVFINLFGVHDWVIRFPSTLASVGIIAVTYLLLLRAKQSRLTALYGAAFVALQPWDIFYGRMAYEAHVALCLLLWSIWLWLSPRRIQQLISYIVLLLAIFTYNTPLLLIPVFLVFIIASSISVPKKIITSVGLLVIFLIGVTFLKNVATQKQAITILSDPTMTAVQQSLYSQSTTWYEKLWNHRETYWARQATMRLWQSWSPSFLTIRGGHNPWHTVPGGAHLYWVSYCLGIIGIGWWLWKNPSSLVHRLWMLLLLFGTLAPAIITIDAPHATRSLLFFWCLTVIASITIQRCTTWMRGVLIVILIGECCLFGWRYFGQFPTYHSAAWPVGLETKLLQTKGKPVVVEAVDFDLAADQLYIYPLLYWQVPPATFLSTVQLGQPDIVHMNRVLGFENFHLNEYNQERVTIIRAADGSYDLKQ